MNLNNRILPAALALAGIAVITGLIIYFGVDDVAKALSDEMDPAILIDICLEEDKKRMAGYDPRLLRPTTMPRLARLARLFVRPKKNP